MMRRRRYPASPMSANPSHANDSVTIPRHAGAFWRGPLRFLIFGANSDPNRPHSFFYRHKLFARATHWINAGVITIMLMSGLQIFNAHPALYIGRQSKFDDPVLSMTAMQEPDGSLRGITQIGPWHFDTTGVFGVSEVDGAPAARGFPLWATIPGPQWLAMGRRYHFFFAWLFVTNGILFVLWALVSGHFRRDLLPRGEDIAHLPREIVDHARLKFAHGDAARRYNALQKLTYFVVIFGLGPLVILTGLTMSPTMDAAFPFLPWIFGGRQTARTIHFICAFSFFGFFLIHIGMVVLSGTWNNLRSMITGRYAIEEERHV
jgi:thiosulfate reductase cytochrome b subunit